MITENYVNFETAKLLKEKGFDEIVNHCYDLYSFEFIPYCAKHGGQVNAPTLQMAMKWLREVYGICIELLFHPNKQDWGWYFQLLAINNIKKCFCGYGPSKTYSSYEEACEAAIKYCLENLI